MVKNLDATKEQMSSMKLNKIDPDILWIEYLPLL